MPITEMKIPEGAKPKDPFKDDISDRGPFEPAKRRPRSEPPKRDLRTAEGKKAQAKEEAKEEKLAARTEACLSAVGLFIQTPLALLGRAKVEFSLDAAAIEQYKVPVAASVAELADAVPVIGTALDSLGAVGPFSNLLEAVIPLAAQIAENHGKLPIQLRDALSVAPKEMLIAELQRREEEARRQAEEMMQNNGADKVGV